VNQATADAVLRAAAYVDAHGDPRARAHAAVLAGRGDIATALALCTPAVTETPSLRAALGAADDLRALGDPCVAEWATALARDQAGDGGFASALAPDARRFETGMIAGYLAKTRYARPQLLLAAAEFLARQWSPDLVQGGSWPAIAAYAHCFANVDHDESDAILQWCGRELGKGFVMRAFDAVRTARVFVYCDAHGLPGAQLAREDLVIALLTEQGSDGSFGDGVASTLDGLVALRRLAG
jgi:hypothetical protein